MTLILLIIAGCALLAYVPLTLVVIHRKKPEPVARTVDEAIEILNTRYGRSELTYAEWESKMNELLRCP